MAPAPVAARQYAVNAAGKKELDVVLSFDTTGSMTPVITSVRNNLRQLTEMLFANTEFDVKISVIAHGDYDHPATLLQVVDFSGNTEELVGFIMNAQLAKVGWNNGEAYEQVNLSFLSALQFLNVKNPSIPFPDSGASPCEDLVLAS